MSATIPPFTEEHEALRESPAYFERVTAVREALHGAPVERANER